jgi:hypothetical protein
LGTVLIVLDVRFYAPVVVDREDITETSVLIEGVAVDVVGWFAGGEDEDGTCAGVRFLCFRCGVSMAVLYRL